MKNFLGINVNGKFRKLSEKQMMEWFNNHKGKIFCSGDVDIFDEGIEWIFDKGTSSIKIKWNEISQVYVSAETGSNNIFIESIDKSKINFYINNRENCRDKFLKYLKEYATLKGALITS